MKLSARNQIRGKIVAVQKGQTTAHVRIRPNSFVRVEMQGKTLARLFTSGVSLLILDDT